MSSQVAVKQGHLVGVAAGHVQQTQYEIKETGITVSIGTCFECTNRIIENTQGSIKLRRYWYFRGLIKRFVLYYMFSLPLAAFIHVGVAGGVMFVDLLWIALFSQYMNIVRKVIPIVLLHPVIPGLPKVNAILQVNVTCVEGRYVCAVVNQSAGIQAGNIDLQYEKAQSAGLIQLSAMGGTFNIQVVSSQAMNQMLQTRSYSFMLLFLAICHFMYALSMLIMILVVSGGKLSYFFDD